MKSELIVPTILMFLVLAGGVCMYILDNTYETDGVNKFRFDKRAKLTLVKIIIGLAVAVVGPLFMIKACEPVHDNSEFHWNGKPKNPLKHIPLYERI